jgi:hypothetical protein
MGCNRCIGLGLFEVEGGRWNYIENYIHPKEGFEYFEELLLGKGVSIVRVNCPDGLLCLLAVENNADIDRRE